MKATLTYDLNKNSERIMHHAAINVNKLAYIIGDIQLNLTLKLEEISDKESELYKVLEGLCVNLAEQVIERGFYELVEESMNS